MNDSPTPQTDRPLVENWITIIGFILACTFLLGEIIVVSLDLFFGSQNPYAGILIYIVGPTILVFGLILVPMGMGLEYRRRARGAPIKSFPVFDLNAPRHRLYLSVFIVGTTLFIMMSMVGTYQAYHVTESTAFCGVLCHQVMEPEYSAYQHSPHARVDCVQCHIGPGANWYVRSKLSGLRQVYQVLSQSFQLPIDTPIEHLRPARDTCEQCHWPEKFYESVEKSLVYYAGDEENTPYRVDLLLHISESRSEPQSRGIHWHIGLDHQLEYYAADEDRQEIPWVRVTYDDGRVEEFVSEELEDFDPTSIPPEQIRTMDCIDCHNRPSHRFRSPHTLVNEAMQFGTIDPTLPEIKSVLLEAMQNEYKTSEEALTALEEQVRQYYQESITEDASLQPKVDQAVKQIQTLYQQNFFPQAGVNWSVYPWNIGHFEFPGCYRCHDDSHKSKEGKTISNDCNLCHTIIRQGEGWEEIKNPVYKEQKFIHPRGYEDDWQGSNCHECHAPGMM